MVHYIKDIHGYMWKSDGEEGAYRRIEDNFRLSNIDDYTHSLHSVSARSNWKKNRSMDRSKKIRP
jgi:hypothetical protein